MTTNLVAGASAWSATEYDVILQQIARQRAGGDFLLFGYVLMPDHLHLLLAPNECGLANAMHSLKRFTAQQIAKEGRELGAVWQARYFDFILRRVGDFWNKLEYIHENPVKAALVAKATDWHWSSAAHYAGSGAAPVPIDSVDFPADRKAWLYPAPWR